MFLVLFTKAQTWWFTVKDHFTNESGAVATEYALLLLLIALAIVVAAGFLGTAIADSLELLVGPSARSSKVGVREGLSDQAIRASFSMARRTPSRSPLRSASASATRPSAWVKTMTTWSKPHRPATWRRSRPRTPR